MENLTLQLQELEALRAVYPEEEGCLELSGAEQVAPHAAHASLSGSVRLPGVQLEQQPVCLRFQLPPGYPTVEPPQLAVECAAVTRSVHEQLTTAVRQAADAAVGSESLLLVLGALQEAVEAAAAAADQGPPASDGSGQEQASPSAGCPHATLHLSMWFHHIKALAKRKLLLDWARELDCGGFSKPGFPGVVVVSGRACDVREYVSRVRSLQWQAMQVRGERLVPCAACAAAGGGTAGGGGTVGAFVELPERGMSEAAQLCRDAGLEDLLAAVLKLG